MIIEQAPLEDELGDVLDKALSHAGLTPAAAAEQAGVSVERLRDAIDYRYDLAPEELDRLAAVLRLNPVGVRALAAGRYPLPRIAGLGFCLHPLRFPHGLGAANAYLVTDCRGGSGVLFDTGPDPARLRRLWPASVEALAGVFITHAETEHVGGLPEARRRFGSPPVFAPRGSSIEGATCLSDGAEIECGSYLVRTLSTPGHAEAHHAYLVRPVGPSRASPVLFGGDLLFAGSVGGGYYCQRSLRKQVDRLFAELPPETVVAPGHGPLTTLAHELRHNPFSLG